jgi:glycosyltransferase involved in cell wall biosynthesis
MRTVDVVADQWVIGWYAMFALEAMSLGKPVLCFLRDDLERLYVDAGVIEEDEMPIIRCDASSLQEALRSLLKLSRNELRELGERSREFVLRHHSLEAVGAVFDRINRAMAIGPKSDRKVS